jgi:phosphoesterase RecJ-like protein
LNGPAENKTINQIRELIRSRDSFLISAHANPDADAVGSCLGLALALNKMGKKAYVLLDTYSEKFDIIPGKRFLYPEPYGGLNAEVFFCLDCGEVNRMGSGALPVFQRTPETVCIDHHMTNKGYASINYIDENASSTSEMIYRLIVDEVEIGEEIATALYAGIVSDTGGFRFDSASGETMKAAGRLMSAGIPFTEIYCEMLLNHTLTESKVLGRVIEASDTMIDGKIIYSCLPLTVFKELNAASKDLEGVPEYLLSTGGVEIAVLFYSKNETDIKVSMRSRRANVAEIAARHSGGGHMLSAGCTLRTDIVTARDTVLPEIAKQLEEADK